ncbi:MAG: hypothetical protein KAJ19_14885 [Gammaproteobacteria bacterium]|nr:hypothetical protein [Gammaproteobacteria bacterium]
MKEDKAENVGWAGEESVTTITVRAVSKRGKQLIKQHGDRWWLCRFDECLPCFDGEGGVLIAPEDDAWHSPDSRWVRATDWLAWGDEDLRPTATAALGLVADITFTPLGEQTGFVKSRVSAGN